MHLRSSICVSLAGAVLAGVAFIIACHTESASENNVTISPSRVLLNKGQSQQFTASGGYEYTWSLDGGVPADEWGYLSATRGASTVYTSTKDASTAGTFRAIHVVSTIPGSGNSDTTTGTNVPSTTTSYSMTAEAYVEHAVKYDTLNVSPAAVSGFKYGSFQTFTASGGNGTYSWNLQDDDLGEISTTTGPNTTYASTSRAMDDNTVNRLRCLSGDGQAINVVIYHANESVTTTPVALTLSPETATLAVNESQTFAASGGDGAYSWSVSTRAYGTLTFASASTVTYLCTNQPTTNMVVRLSVASNGETRNASILHTAQAVTELTITPADVTRTNYVNQSVEFTASGGTKPYSWDWEPKGFGTLSVSTESKATYKATVWGPNQLDITVSVTDADLEKVDATFTQRMP